MKITAVLYFLIPVILIGCSSNKVEKNKNGKNKIPAKINWANKQIAPDYSRIVGTIVSIDSSLNTSALQSPCAKVPCNATVKIDSVLGYGSNFPPLSIGHLIDVHFNFTLSPTTKDLFPNMQDYFPGLQVGSRFEGDIYTQLEKGNINNSKQTFGIYGYEVKKK